MQSYVFGDCTDDSTVRGLVDNRAKICDVLCNNDV